MGAVNALDGIAEYGFSDVAKIILLVVVATLLIGEAKDKLKSRFGKTHRELKDESVDNRLKELDTKINEKYNELNCRIDGFYDKQKEYHAESINIRSGLADKQEEIVSTLGSIADLLNEMKENQNEMKEEQRDEKIQRMRWQILEVANYIRNKEDVNMEQLNNALNIYDDYEKILKQYNLSNGQVDVSIQLIREKKLEIMHGES